MLRCLMLILAINVCHAEVYSWKDENGKLHFSDAKPMSVESEVKHYDGAQPKADHELQQYRRYAKQRNNQYQQQKFADKVEASRQQALAKSKALSRKKLCYAAKRELGILDSGVPVYNINNNGEREFLSNDQQKSEIIRTRKLVKRNC